ncbi:MAG: hypothetical protein GY747_08045 [Planctomycetes bacterium]|nr:hypothetical protein [Planctomycetota bacterium]MCP4771133.1 hypothetical protein [Planctomycetota bacterium]MCP4862140.1 hypothetical protein [Planctomycetota bacterium]
MTDNSPFESEQKLTDPDYRAEMLNKVEALISVLEVARHKIVTNIDTGAADADRMLRVKRQVENTLKVCRRARTALRGANPISKEDVFNTDIDDLCSQLVGM